MFQKCKYVLFLIAPIFLQAISGKAARAEEILQSLDSTIEQALKDYQVPGLSIGVVVDGEIVYTKGFGYRDVEKKLPVTKDTLFPIGSCTKALTSFVVGNLVDEGLLKWDEIVIDVLPEFRLWDPYATQNLTIRDLLTHRSGLPRHDFMWYTSDMSRSEMMKKIRYLEPSTDIRERYQYNNLMYLTAACAAEEVSGQTWEELITERILQPLGMHNTTFTYEDIQKSDNYSSGYIEKQGQLKKLSLRNAGPVAPAGGLNSNVLDLCRWVQLNLNQGDWNGKRLISPATLQEIHSPQIIIPGAPESKEARIYAYGIGWHIVAYRGQYYLFHDGGIDGFTSCVGFLPEQGIGFAILTNKNLNSLPRYLSCELMDRLQGIPDVHWLKSGLEGYKKSKESMKEKTAVEDKLRKKGTHPSHALDEYAGEYEHPGYGKIRIAVVNGKLQAQFNGITFFLEHWHYDIFSIADESPDLFVSLEGSKVTFRNSINGDIEDLIIPFEPTTNDIVFKRQASSEGAHLHLLKRLTGFYELYGYTVEIGLRDHVLVAVIPGQPVYDLVPLGDTEFTVKAMTGFNIRFVLNENNQVKEVLIVAPYGAFTATPKK